jgi:hypothetical protein
MARWARYWFGATALVVAVAIAIDMTVSAAGYRYGPFATPESRVVNMFSYFTIQSNLLVGVTAVLLARQPDRGSPVFRVFRLAGVVGIVITALVYHVVLAPLYHPTGWSFVADELLHTAVPVLAVAGWLLFGPRAHASWPGVLASLVYPAGYLVLTLVRGAAINWYPYPFLDVSHLGYAGALRNAALVAALFIAVGAGAVGLDRWLARPRPCPSI